MTLLQVNKDVYPPVFSESGRPEQKEPADSRVVTLGSGALSQATASQLNLLLPNVTIKPDSGLMSSRDMETSILGADLVLDGSGNDNDRYLINRTCLKMGVPWVYAAIRDGYGLLMVIIPKVTPCFECLMGQPGDSFFQPHPPTLAAGILPMVASLQVSQAYHLLMGDSHWLRGLIYVDAWTSHYETIEIKGRKGICPACGFGGQKY